MNNNKLTSILIILCLAFKGTSISANPKQTVQKPQPTIQNSKKNQTKIIEKQPNYLKLINKIKTLSRKQKIILTASIGGVLILVTGLIVYKKYNNEENLNTPTPNVPQDNIPKSPVDHPQKTADIPTDLNPGNKNPNGGSFPFEEPPQENPHTTKPQKSDSSSDNMTKTIPEDPPKEEPNPKGEEEGEPEPNESKLDIFVKKFGRQRKRLGNWLSSTFGKKPPE